MPVMTYIDAINTALREEMERDPCVFLIGEDIGKMGGAFKATKGLLDEFGSERVIDSPLGGRHHHQFLDWSCPSRDAAGARNSVCGLYHPCDGCDHATGG